MFLVVIFFKFDFIQESGSDMKFAIEYLCKDIPLLQGISSKIRENLMSLNNKYKSPCEMITTQLYHKKTKSKETV